MSLSMKRAMDILNEKQNALTLAELMFVLIVFRDNSVEDDVYEFLNNVITKK